MNRPFLTKVAGTEHYQMEELLIEGRSDMAEASSTVARHSPFMNLPAEIRLKIYLYVIHDPAAIIELVGPHADCEASHLWEQEDDWHDEEEINNSLKILNPLPPPTSILLTCRKCHNEARHLLHEQVSLSVQTVHDISPFLALVRKPKRHKSNMFTSALRASSPEWISDGSWPCATLSRLSYLTPANFFQGAFQGVSTWRACREPKEFRSEDRSLKISIGL